MDLDLARHHCCCVRRELSAVVISEFGKSRIKKGGKKVVRSFFFCLIRARVFWVLLAVASSHMEIGNVFITHFWTSGVKKGEQVKAWSIVMHNVYFFIRISRRVNLWTFSSCIKPKSSEHGTQLAVPKTETSARELMKTRQRTILTHDEAHSERSRDCAAHTNKQQIQPCEWRHPRAKNRCSMTTEITVIVQILTLFSRSSAALISHAIHFSIILRLMKINFDNSSKPFSSRSYRWYVINLCEVLQFWSEVSLVRPDWSWLAARERMRDWRRKV